MASATQAALPKVCISSTLSSSVRNASIASGGIGLLYLYTHMGTAQTSMIVHHCWENTPTGELHLSVQATIQSRRSVTASQDCERYTHEKKL